MLQSGAARSFALTIGAGALVVASVAGAAVYKCTAASGAVTYQDFPCAGGTLVDIRPGASDPTAIERLDRANAEFNRNATARTAIEAQAAIRREEFDLQRHELEVAQGTGAASPDLSYIPEYAFGFPAYGFGAPFMKRRAGRPHSPRPSVHVGTVPKGRVPADIRRPRPG